MRSHGHRESPSSRASEPPFIADIHPSANRNPGAEMSRNKAPEESRSSGKLPKGGAESRHEGGFREGEFGRGPTPYKLSHSHKNGAIRETGPYMGPAGRGGAGTVGKSDNFKQRSEDVEHPSSHAAFERLGHSEE
jgi:hypothetical protein